MLHRSNVDLKSGCLDEQCAAQMSIAVVGWRRLFDIAWACGVKLGFDIVIKFIGLNLTKAFQHGGQHDAHWQQQQHHELKLDLRFACFSGGATMGSSFYSRGSTCLRSASSNLVVVCVPDKRKIGQRYPERSRGM